MKEKIYFAIVGAGKIAYRHVDAIHSTKHGCIVAVCDLDVARAKSLANYAHAKHYDSIFLMLQAHPEISVVIILTPTGLHFAHASTIIEKHNKHVVIEKPMVLRLDHARYLQKLARKKNKYIFPIYQHRFNRAVQFVKKNLGIENALGKLCLLEIELLWCRPQRYYDQNDWRGTWAMDGGVLTNQGIHFLDLLIYLGGPIKNVCASLATLNAAIEVEDTATAIIEFGNGARGTITMTTAVRNQDFQASLTYVGQKGLAKIGGLALNELLAYSSSLLDYGAARLIQPTKFTPSAYDLAQLKSQSEKFNDTYGFGHNTIYENIVQVLHEDSQPLVSFESAYESLQLLHAIYNSDETKKWVDVASCKDSLRLGRAETADM